MNEKAPFNWGLSLEHSNPGYKKGLASFDYLLIIKLILKEQFQVEELFQDNKLFYPKI